MDFKTYAFISYQTSDKVIAGRVKNVLLTVRIDSFLAHEDIHVSEEWRLKILEEISKADIFIPLLSKNYHESPWCVQEAGIAAFRNDIIGSSRSYRNAEANFQLILPYISKMEDDQIIILLEKSSENSQVHDAGLCAVDYIPPLLDSHGHLLDPIIYDFLKKNCDRYA